MQILMSFVFQFAIEAKSKRLNKSGVKIRKLSKFTEMEQFSTTEERSAQLLIK